MQAWRNLASVGSNFATILPCSTKPRVGVLTFVHPSGSWDWGQAGGSLGGCGACLGDEVYKYLK